MKVNLSGAKIAQTPFSGVKDGIEFRKEAKNIINDLKNVELGSFEYTTQNDNEKSLRERLLTAIFSLPQKIGKNNITNEDRILHENLKSLYKEYQEADDFTEAATSADGRFIDRTIDYCI